ncbi:MAG TPA: tetratricopeptide repeat protein, partial [Terriglobia bacterium]|nr:tetratricopeptide repeat protein [Terriglobia bacterium]
SSGKDPYFLYAVSNAGSLIALIAYPVLLEPRIGVKAQSALWLGGYIALGALVAVAASIVWRTSPAFTPTHSGEKMSAPGWRTRLFWLAAAFVPSALMLAVTNHLLLNLASVPFLWILPLAVYLVTFMLAFGRRIYVSVDRISQIVPIVLLLFFPFVANSRAEVADLESAYSAMIEPFLVFKRTNLANQAMGLLAQVPKKEPASLQIAMAKLNMDSANLTRAEELLKDARAQLKPESPLTGEEEELSGLLYEALGNTDQAKLHYRNSVKAEPDRPQPLRKLAELAAKDQSWSEAGDWMEQYVATQPQQAGHFWAMLGDYRLGADQVEQGSKALQTSLQVDPYTYWAHYRMARLFEKNKDTENAIKEYEYIVRYDFDRDPDVYVKLATLYKAAGRKSDALRVLTKGHRIFAPNSAIYRLYHEVQESY